MKPIVGPIIVRVVGLHENTFVKVPFQLYYVSCSWWSLVYLVQSFFEVIALFLAKVSSYMCFGTVHNWWAACSNLVILQSWREWSKPVKIIEVFHTRWVININHKTMTIVSTHFCLSRTSLIIFRSYVKYLVQNFNLRNCDLHFHLSGGIINVEYT